MLIDQFVGIIFTKGGKTAYFGDLGEGCKTMIDYFESKVLPVSSKCQSAEWMLDIVQARDLS